MATFFMLGNLSDSVLPKIAQKVGLPALAGAGDRTLRCLPTLIALIKLCKLLIQGFLRWRPKPAQGLPLGGGRGVLLHEEG